MAEPRTQRADADAAGTTADAEAEAATLRDLERRLERATRAAERLLAEAAAQRAVPPAGWRSSGDGDEQARGAGWIDAEDAQRLLAVLAGLLERVPVELQQRVVAALRELLLAVRALIDWCLERAERRRGAPVEVQDIPIL